MYRHPCVLYASNEVGLSPPFKPGQKEIILSRSELAGETGVTEICVRFPFFSKYIQRERFFLSLKKVQCREKTTRDEIFVGRQQAYSGLHSNRRRSCSDGENGRPFSR
jgi:hypothetical protein